LAADASVTFALNPDGTIPAGEGDPGLTARTDFSFDFQDLVLTMAKGGGKWELARCASSDISQ
jgi:hypothetical protein